MAKVVPIKKTDLTNYDPEKGLKSIAVAEAAEKHWARARDPAKLFEAVEHKLREQRFFVAWYDAQEWSKGAATPRGDRTVTAFVADVFGLKRDDDTGINAAVKRTSRWRAALKSDEDFGCALEDAQGQCRRICEQEAIGTVRGTEGTGEVELYTPARYIEAARAVLGEIDLDPASNDIAQKTVKASKYFTVKTDGLKRQWKGRVWLNPPYHRDLLPAFVDKMVAEVDAKRVTAAIMLTNNCTDTEWFGMALSSCAAVCFTKGRIKFERPNGKKVLPTQGQTFFYFGGDVERFESVFFSIGFGMIPKWDFQERK